MPRSLVALPALLAALAFAPPAFAVRDAGPPSDESAGPGRRVRNAAVQAALERGPAWSAFRARHGAWRATWNERTATPHLATGPAIRLGGRAEDGPTVDRLVRGFIASHPEVFRGTRDSHLETLRAQRAGRVWYLSYRRRVAGVPVLFEDWEFRVSASGELMAFGADAHSIPAGLTATPAIDAAAARDAARRHLGLAADAPIEVGETLHWLPEPGSDATALHLVREVRARQASPPHHWVVLVDAANGAVRWQHDRVRHEVVGGITGPVHLTLPTSPTEIRGFGHQRVTVGGNVVYADATGLYVSPASGTVTVTTGIEGRHCNVDRYDGPDASFSTVVTDPALAYVEWSNANSTQAERDAYYHVNQVHDHVRTLDPALTGLDYEMPCGVGITEAWCNAFWDGLGVYFYAAGGGCPDIATLPDVVYHEYGHGVNDVLYASAGSPFGMLNGALHEGLADVTAAFLTDDPVIGDGFFGPGTALRGLVNTMTWPQDGNADPHISGLIIGGALWDLRNAVGLAVAEPLSHFAKYGIPDDADDGIAMSEYFVQLLIADDDDGDLDNGTPHFAQIAAAFNAHGIGTGAFVHIHHVPLQDQPAPGPYLVDAEVVYTGPFGGLDPAGLRVHYSVNDSPLGSVPLVPNGVDQYRASVPAPSGTIVRYYVKASEQYGGSVTVPRNPAAETFTFLAGAVSQILIHDHESNAGWIPADVSDNATTGRWQWVEPLGSFIDFQPVQTEDDHTSYGILCYVTANPTVDYSPGAHDVDDGKTTLYTSAFDATAAGPDPLIEYYRWYTNHLGASPSNDLWRVDLSNDGGMSWTPVESTAASNNSWQRVVFFVRDFLPPTALMRLRFIAEDIGSPSLVEAAVDDLRLLRFDGGTTAVGAPTPTTRLALAPPSPNPSAHETRFSFALAARGAASLAVYDVSGRRMRSLREGVLEAGSHQAVWNGRDDAGNPAPSGLYFARLAAEGRTLTQRLVRHR